MTLPVLSSRNNHLLCSYGAALKEIDATDRQETGHWMTTGRRIHICLSNDENGQCSASGSCEVCGSSPPFTLLSTIDLIRNGASQLDPISNTTAPPLLLSGAISARHNGQCHCSCRNRFELVCSTVRIGLMVWTAPPERHRNVPCWCCLKPTERRSHPHDDYNTRD